MNKYSVYLILFYFCRTSSS